MASRAWRYGLLVALVAVTASSPTVNNLFVQDDQPAIAEDPRIHDPSQWPRFLSEPYWPEKFGGDLYRPIASLTLGVEWQLGGGAPFSFRVMSIALYAAAAIAVYHLALLLMSPGAALAAALLFAIHPVHVEAVAVAVNQGEIIVCLLMTLAAARYIRDRRAQDVSWRTRWLLFAATLIGCGYKETAAVLPALLAVAELTVLRSAPRRWTALGSLLGLQVLAVATIGVLRYMVHGDRFAGTFVAEAISGATTWQRFLSMLGGVVPEWLRLLLWPANLQADYSPRVIMAATRWGVDQTLGLAIIALIGFLAWRLRHKAPVFAFGVGWTAVGLLPVHNVLVPTGIMLAERTLFTPSVGTMLAVIGLGTAMLDAVPVARRSRMRRVAWAAVAVVMVLGMTRSISRHQVWRTSLTLWRQTVIDAPDSYRARVALGSLMLGIGWKDRGEQAFRDGLALWDGSSGPLFTLADMYRRQNRCADALPLYIKALAIEEFAPGRASLVTCRAFLGQYAPARQEALDGMRSGFYTQIFRVWVRTLDGAMRTNLPPGTVRFPAEFNYLFDSAIKEKGVLGRTRVAEGVHMMPEEE